VQASACDSQTEACTPVSLYTYETMLNHRKTWHPLFAGLHFFLDEALKNSFLCVFAVN